MSAETRHRGLVSGRSIPATRWSADDRPEGPEIGLNLETTSESDTHAQMWINYGSEDSVTMRLNAAQCHELAAQLLERAGLMTLPGPQRE